MSANYVSNDFTGANDGIVGMKSSSDEKPTPFATLMKNPQCQEKVFAFWFNSDLTGNEEDGELTLCGINKNRYTDGIIFARTGMFDWEFLLDEVTADNHLVVDLSVAVPDPSAAVIFVPTRYISTLYTYIGIPYTGHNNLSTVNCDSVNKLPDVTFKISGHPFILTARDYVLNELGVCFVGFLSGDSKLWVLGHGKRFHDISWLL